MNGGFHISFGGPEYSIISQGCVYRFEMPHGCGLQPINADGSGRRIDWPGHVWVAVQKWTERGEQIDDRGKCVYTIEENTA